MQTSNTSATKKVVVGLVLGAGIILGVSSSACTVTTTTGCISPDVACGDGTCGLPDNVACTFNSDCCGNYCAPDGFCGPGSTCLADGLGCAVDSDCCTGVCSFGDQTCGCVVTNSTGCGHDSDCCSSADLCINGICQ